VSPWAKPEMTVDEAADAAYALWGCTEPRHMDKHMRAILHGVRNDALERVARLLDGRLPYDAEMVRKLKHELS
jgi:cytochrome c556